jgi:hypothetical protein
MNKIGVIATQGDVSEHINAMKKAAERSIYKIVRIKHKGTIPGSTPSYYREAKARPYPACFTKKAWLKRYFISHPKLIVNCWQN